MRGLSYTHEAVENTYFTGVLRFVNVRKPVFTGFYALGITGIGLLCLSEW